MRIRPSKVLDTWTGYVKIRGFLRTIGVLRIVGVAEFIAPPSPPRFAIVTQVITDRGSKRLADASVKLTDEDIELLNGARLFSSWACEATAAFRV